MSDEMVQESSGAAELTPVESPDPGHPRAEAVATDSSAAATTEVAQEPAPAQSVDSAPAIDTTPPAPIEDSNTKPAAESDDDIYSMAGYDRSLRQLHEGDVITGTVMRVDREGVLVDVGAKSEGIIRLNELARDASSSLNPEDIVKVGQQIRVYVLQPENNDGNPILSKKRADFEQAWEKVQLARDKGETLHAMVTDRVKGGLTVDLGIRGFVPASHVGSGSLKNNLDKYVGQSIALKVIEVDKERHKVVLSNKFAVAEEREAKSTETKLSLSPQQIRHGVVRRLTNYGAFIDLGGIDGLLHISEMSWTRINDPKEVLREGQELDVIVLKMDLENNRVSLGLRQILPDPWTEIAGRYKEGDVITGKVTRIVPFGAFVQVDGRVEGIIPTAEMPRPRGGKPAAVVTPNEDVQVKVISLRPEERKMTLSLRALQPPEEPAAREAAAPREGAAPARERRGGRPERDDRDDFNRYAPGRQEEPRFNQLGEAFAAARRTERTKRDRRNVEEDDTYDYEDIDEEIITVEPEADAPEGAPEAEHAEPEHKQESAEETL